MITRLALAGFLAIAGMLGAARAQVAPYVHGGNIGTSPIQVLATDTARKKILLHNPNASVTIAYCPAGPNRDTGQPVVCAVNGAGSITLLPYSSVVIEGALPNGLSLPLSSAWNGVASGSGVYSILDFE